MKILLVNANPVVGKLVTLSAQKTGDELTSVSSIDEVPSQSYDLLLVDDNSYTQELFEELNAKVSFSQSCFIGSRTSVKPDVFSHEFNKPFLPTDLVDIFMDISSSMNAQITEEAAVKEESLNEDLGPISKPDVTEDEFEFDELMPSLDEDENEGNALPSLDDDLFTDLETIDDDEVEEGYDAPMNILDEDDVKEVQGLLDETDEEESAEVSEDFGDQLPSYSADEKTLEEISAALDELDEENEDELLLDDNASENEAEKGLEGMEDLEGDLEDLFEGLDMDEAFGEELEDEVPAQAAAISEELPEELEEDESADETDDLLGMEEESMDATEISDEELAKMFDETEIEDEDTASELSMNDELLEGLDEDDLSALDEETALDTAEAKDDEFDALDALDEFEESVPEEKAAIAEDTLELDEELDDEEALLDTLDFEDELDDEESAELMESGAKDEAADALEEFEESAEDEKAAIAEEEMQEEEPVDTLEEDKETVDLSALNKEIEAALDDLDEDDLLSELDESDLEGFEDDFSSISANELKLALGEEIPEELEQDEEELEIQEALNALEFMDEEEEEEPELLVGQSEFASLHEEALNEAMGERDEMSEYHPELDEIDAFVDQVPVGGDALPELSVASSSNESIASLERLIATLKQGNVKEALKGMDMNITISFSEKEI